jgi:acyl-ACP thioesterase
VLVSRENGHILRKPLEEFLPYFNEEPLEEHPMDMPKPVMPEEMGERTAAYSLCDRNGHLNNTRYADIVCDALPPECLAKGPVRQMLLYYRSEIPFGETFTLTREAVGEDGYYVAAVKNGTKKFEGSVLF